MGIPYPIVYPIGNRCNLESRGHGILCLLLTAVTDTKNHYYTTRYIVSNDIFLLCHEVASTSHELFTGQ